MHPTRSRQGELGLTLVEVMIVVMLSFVVVLGAGAVYRGVSNSFRQSAHMVIGHQGATHLSRVISRQVRVASGFVVYTLPNRDVPTATGDGLALLDGGGAVMYRFEWDSAHNALADSNGTAVAAAELQTIQFRPDPITGRTVRYSFQAFDDAGNYVDIESAVSLRN